MFIQIAWTEVQEHRRGARRQHWHDAGPTVALLAGTKGTAQGRLGQAGGDQDSAGDLPADSDSDSVPHCNQPNRGNAGRRRRSRLLRAPNRRPCTCAAAAAPQTALRPRRAAGAQFRRL